MSQPAAFLVGGDPRTPARLLSCPPAPAHADSLYRTASDPLSDAQICSTYRLDTHLVLDASHTLNQTSMCRNRDDTRSFASSRQSEVRLRARDGTAAARILMQMRVEARTPPSLWASARPVVGLSTDSCSSTFSAIWRITEHAGRNAPYGQCHASGVAASVA